MEIDILSYGHVLYTLSSGELIEYYGRESIYRACLIFWQHEIQEVVLIARTLLGCQATDVTEDSCLFRISLLTHLRTVKSNNVSLPK